jgi:hypothetical protein
MAFRIQFIPGEAYSYSGICGFLLRDQFFSMALCLLSVVRLRRLRPRVALLNACFALSKKSLSKTLPQLPELIAASA